MTRRRLGTASYTPRARRVAASLRRAPASRRRARGAARAMLLPRRAAALLLAGCGLPCALRGSSAQSCSAFDAARAAFPAAALAAGAAVRTGGFSMWASDESCIAAGDCGNANPTSPYAMATLPPLSGGAQQTDWPLGAGEVVVLWACVPPRARYVGYTAYLHTVVRNATRFTVFASLADTASAGTAGAARSDPGGADPPTFCRFNSSAGGVADGTVSRSLLPFGENAVLLLGASPPAVAAVRAMLVPLLGSGGDGMVTTLPLADKYYAPDSTYSLYQRYALPEDPAAWAAWAAAPPVSVWSVTPALRPPPGGKAAARAATYPLPTLIPKAGFSEAWMQPAADALAAAVAAFLANGGGNVSISSAARSNPMQSSAFCIATATNCGGDNRDTTYIQALPLFVLPAAPSSVVVIVGANHRATRNGHYANVAVYDTDTRLGVTAAADDSLGAATGWLRGTVHEAAAASLYALALSRSCPPWLPVACLRVPAAGWPRAALGHYLAAVERPYAAQDTTAGPLASSLVLPQLVLVNIDATRAPAPPPGDPPPLRTQVANARVALDGMRTRVPAAPPAA